MEHFKNSILTGRNDKFLEELLKHLQEKQLSLDKFKRGTIISEAVDSGISEASATLFEQLKTTAPEMLKKRRKDIVSFEKRLVKLWREPFDLLEIFLAISYEAGKTFNEEMRPEAAQNNDLVFDALTRLHSRACQIGGEILTLLRSGYAAGAHTRWRTLHEIVVVGFFIRQHGNKVAGRYLFHNAIESYKATIEYEKYSSTLGYAPLTEEEIRKAKALRDQLCEKFGKSFGNRYGWAVEAIGKDDPNLSDLERVVNLDHFRPLYRMASHPVHANPKGVTSNLGLLKDEEILLAGPSNAGMADPGHSTAISLHQINAAVLTVQPSLQAIVVLCTMERLVNEIDVSFLKIHKLLKNPNREST